MLPWGDLASHGPSRCQGFWPSEPLQPIHAGVVRALVIGKAKKKKENCMHGIRIIK
jgi:hypothetical protein